MKGGVIGSNITENNIEHTCWDSAHTTNVWIVCGIHFVFTGRYHFSNCVCDILKCKPMSLSTSEDK